MAYVPIKNEGEGTKVGEIAIMTNWPYRKNLPHAKPCFTRSVSCRCAEKNIKSTQRDNSTYTSMPQPFWRPLILHVGSLSIMNRDKVQLNLFNCLGATNEGEKSLISTDLNL